MSAPRDPLPQLLDLHHEVDAATRPLETLHAERLQCRRGCSACCVDDITVFGVEAERIRTRHAELLSRGAPHPPGACAFLDTEGACRIYADRPYVCRTQGLPLRWTEEGATRTVEYRDICELNETGDPLETLPVEACWTLGPFEGRLAVLQSTRGEGGMERIPLRDLFAATPGPAIEE